MIHEKNKRDLRFILTIKIDISYGMSFLTELSIAPKLQMDSIFPLEKKITKTRELSFCSEKPVVPVINQMERTFPLEIFRKKRNTF